jgi:hypothetical protein
MNNIILAHLNNLAEKADKKQNATWANYKPVSPFKTNKIKRIDENITEVYAKHMKNLLKLDSYENLY